MKVCRRNVRAPSRVTIRHGRGRAPSPPAFFVDLQVMRTMDFRVEGELLQLRPLQTLFDERSDPCAQDGMRGHCRGTAAKQEGTAEAAGGEAGWPLSLHDSVGAEWRLCSGDRTGGKSEASQSGDGRSSLCTHALAESTEVASRTQKRVSRKRTNSTGSRFVLRKTLRQFSKRPRKLVAMPPTNARRTRR